MNTAIALGWVLVAGYAASLGVRILRDRDGWSGAWKYATAEFAIAAAAVVLAVVYARMS